MSRDIYNIKLNEWQIAQIIRALTEMYGKSDGIDEIVNTLIEQQVIQDRKADSTPNISKESDELTRKWNNIKNGKGVYLTQEEFEKQCEVD